MPVESSRTGLFSKLCLSTPFIKFIGTGFVANESVGNRGMDSKVGNTTFCLFQKSVWNKIFTHNPVLVGFANGCGSVAKRAAKGMHNFMAPLQHLDNQPHPFHTPVPILSGCVEGLKNKNSATPLQPLCTLSENAQGLQRVAKRLGRVEPGRLFSQNPL